MTIEEEADKLQKELAARIQCQPGTFEELADRIGCTRMTLHNIVKGHSKLINMKYGFVLKLKEVLSWM